MIFVSPPCLRLCPYLPLALRLCLCLALTLVGATGMQAGAAPAGAMPLVICSHDGASVIWLDALGNTVPAPSQSECQRCPDCLAASAALALPGLTALPQRFDVFALARPALAQINLTAVPAIPPVARGPPRQI